MTDAQVFGGRHEGERGPSHADDYRTAGRARQYFESGLSILLSYGLSGSRDSGSQNQTAGTQGFRRWCVRVANAIPLAKMPIALWNCVTCGISLLWRKL